MNDWTVVCDLLCEAFCGRYIERKIHEKRTKHQDQKHFSLCFPTFVYSFVGLWVRRNDKGKKHIYWLQWPWYRKKKFFLVNHHLWIVCKFMSDLARKEAKVGELSVWETRRKKNKTVRRAGRVKQTSKISNCIENLHHIHTTLTCDIVNNVRPSILCLEFSWNESNADRHFNCCIYRKCTHSKGFGGRQRRATTSWTIR